MQVTMVIRSSEQVSCSRSSSASINMPSKIWLLVRFASALVAICSASINFCVEQENCMCCLLLLSVEYI